MSRSVKVLLVVAAAISAAACTSNASDETSRPDQATSANSTPSPPPEFTGVGHKLPKGKALRNDPDLYKTVSLDGCTKVKGGWRAQGTATNETDEERGYSILVFFTDAQARTVDFARTKVGAAASSSARWTATKTFKGPVEVNCVVRAVTSAS